MPLRVDPWVIAEQRELGWPDIHPEDYCHRCGVAFESWVTDRVTWLTGTSSWAAQTGREGICCVTCFTQMFAAATGADPIWELRRYGADCLATLASNLAMAGALCRSFTLGRKHADDLWDVDMHGKLWRPGWGKAAP